MCNQHFKFNLLPFIIVLLDSSVINTLPIIKFICMIYQSKVCSRAGLPFFITRSLDENRNYRDDIFETTRNKSIIIIIIIIGEQD